MRLFAKCRLFQALDVAIALIACSVLTGATAQAQDEGFGLRWPQNWPDLAPWDPSFPLPGALPSQFDWSALFPHPIRHQYRCGSCWAFATVGALEYQILINERTNVDLSEEWLVTCNQDNGNCGDGGYTAHNYFLLNGAETDDCGGYGAPLESDLPYTATDAECACPVPHRYWLQGWSYIGVVPGLLATDAQIKNAIYQHGPITAAVCADNWPHSGDPYPPVFEDCSNCDGQFTNHVILIVGWDDERGGGAWKIRNSWGAAFANEGYLWLRYGCSSIGIGANYVQYPPGNGVWVDTAYSGLVERGWFNEPYNTLAEGFAAVASGGTVSLKPGSAPSSRTLANPVVLRGFSGPFVFGQ